MKRTLKIVIPMAGWGTRMRPHTWSKPKPLVGVAGKPSFDHLMDMFQSIPADFDIEFVFIISPYLGEQIPVYVEKHYPSIKANYIVQDEMKGQSHAIWLSRKLIEGPTIVIFSDTLLDTDFSFLSTFQYDGVAWVKPVPDPRRFGVAVVDADQNIQKLIEKPTELENNLVVVGCYYFKNGSDLVKAVDRQLEENIQLKGEFFLADAINLMLKGGSKMTIQPVEVWLDTGTIEATLETNRFMLDHGKDNSSKAAQIPNVRVISPVFVHPNARVSNSIIGPHVSIGANCVIENTIISNSIVDEGSEVRNTALQGSFIGRNTKVDGTPKTINIGDNSILNI